MSSELSAEEQRKIIKFEEVLFTITAFLSVFKMFGVLKFPWIYILSPIWVPDAFLLCLGTVVQVLVLLGVKVISFIEFLKDLYRDMFFVNNRKQ